MLNKFYFLIILKILNKNIYYNIYDYNLILNSLEKKIFINFFFNLKLKVNKSLKLIAETKYHLAYHFHAVKLNNSLKKKKNIKAINKNSGLFFQLNFKNSIFNIEHLNSLYNFYKDFFISNLKINSINYNRLYTDLYFKKRLKVSIVLNFFLKKNFLNFLNFLITSSYLNLKPLIISDEYLSEDIFVFDDYVNFLNKKDNYDYIFVINPYLKLKYLSVLRKYNLPIFSVIDNNISTEWLDYYIPISKIDNFSIYYFFCFIFQIYIFGQKIRKKNYSILFNNFLKLNTLKKLNLNY